MSDLGPEGESLPSLRPADRGETVSLVLEITQSRHLPQEETERERVEFRTHTDTYTLSIDLSINQSINQSINHTHTHLAGAGVPEVHSGTQTNCQQVLRGPVEEVEVEVVLEFRSIQHFERSFRDLASHPSRR